MVVFDVSNPLTLFLLLVATVLLVFLGKEVKKPYAPAFSLFFFLILVIIHSIQFATLSGSNVELYKSTLFNCIALDLIMIFVTFFSYLWIDDVSSKFYKKKSIDNSLDWFWKQV